MSSLTGSLGSLFTPTTTPTREGIGRQGRAADGDSIGGAFSTPTPSSNPFAGANQPYAGLNWKPLTFDQTYDFQHTGGPIGGATNYEALANVLQNAGYTGSTKLTDLLKTSYQYPNGDNPNSVFGGFTRGSSWSSGYSDALQNWLNSKGYTVKGSITGDYNKNGTAYSGLFDSQGNAVNIGQNNYGNEQGATFSKLVQAGILAMAGSAAFTGLGGAGAATAGASDVGMGGLAEAAAGSGAGTAAGLGAADVGMGGLAEAAAAGGAGGTLPSFGIPGMASGSIGAGTLGPGAQAAVDSLAGPMGAGSLAGPGELASAGEVAGGGTAASTGLEGAAGFMGPPVSLANAGTAGSSLFMGPAASLASSGSPGSDMFMGPPTSLAGAGTPGSDLFMGPPANLAGAGTGATSGLGGLFSSLPQGLQNGLSSLFNNATSPQGLAALLGAYNANDSKNTWKDQMANIDRMFATDSPYAKQMQETLARKDAAAGRNSQYGPRAENLAANLTSKKADMTKDLINIQDRMNSDQTSKLRDLTSIFGAGNSGQSVFGSGGLSGVLNGVSTGFKSILDLFGG